MNGATVDYAPRTASPSDSVITAGWWGVVILFLVHGLVVSTWVSRIASVKVSLGLSDAQLGVALLGTAIGSVTAIPICGILISRFGSKRAVLWTGTGFCLSLGLVGLATSVTSLFMALLVFGAMAGGNDVAMNAQAVGVERNLGRPTMSRFHAMFSLGGIVGASLGGVVATWGVAPFRHLTVGALLFLGLVVASAPLMIDTNSVEKRAGRLPLRQIPITLVALSAIGFCIFLSEGAIADWTAVYLLQVLHAGPGLAAAGYAVFSASMTVFRLAGDAITMKLGRAGVIRWGGLLAAAGLAFAVSVQSPYLALAGFAAAGAGFSSIIPVVFAAGGRIPSLSEGTGVATVSGLGYLGFLVGPPAIGFLSELTSLRAGMFLLVLLSIAAALLVGVVDRTTTPGANPLEDA